MKQHTAVGVDAGGTSTAAAVSREGVYERTERGGPANPSSLGVPAAADAIAQTVRAALAAPGPFALYVGAAGAGAAGVAAALRDALVARLPEARELAVCADTEIALRAVIPEGPGVVLIAGTGSVAYAVNAERTVTVGGYGYLLGDEGSAFALGFGAAKLLARVYDGRARADETSALVERALGCSDRAGLLHALYAGPLEVAKFAALAPSILAFAGKGNRASTKLVQGAAQELGDLVRGAAQQAGLAEASPSVALAGGLLRENSLLSFLLEHRLTNELPGVAVLRSRDEPARAALRFAEAAPHAPATAE
jgi:glucosamine kinase